MKRKPSSSVRFLTASVIILFSLCALYLLSVRFLAQYYVAGAGKNVLHLNYISATQQLQKALKLQPDDFRIHNELGNVYYKLGSKDQERSNALQLLGKARDHFQQALRFHPLDARSAYGLARTEILVEKINYLSGKGSLLPKDSPALNALEKAIALRPASTIYRLAHARYLYLHYETDKLLSEMRNLGRLQPSLYGSLRGEPFWSPAVRGEFFTGVKLALAQGITPRQSFVVASELMKEEKNWAQAISYREQGMEIQPSLNNSADYIRLGSLYLYDRQPDQAQTSFFVAITMSEDIELDILKILRTCRKADEPESLIKFYRDISKVYGNSNKIEITAARHLFDLKEYEDARIILTENISKHPNGEAYYWLSRIAEVDQDWDEVELTIQKAAMYSPRDSSYHLRFSQVLNRLQKYERASKEAGKAIKYSGKQNVSLYTYRARLRNRLKDHEGALEDWQQAISLEPDKGSYYYQAGDASEKMDRIDEAAEYFQKAIELEPGNKKYIQRLERIVKKYGAKDILIEDLRN